MREVVHRVDAPLVAGAVMGGMADAVDGGVAHHDIGGSHVDLGAQNVLAVFEFTGLHAAEEVEAFFGGAVAPRGGDAGLGEGAAVFADLLGVQLVHVGLAHHDELFGVFVELVEVVGSVVHVAFPLEAEPLHVLLDGFDVFGIFLHRVGIVEAQVALAVIFLCKAEVDADGLRVPDVQIAVGLRREAGMHARVEAAGGVVLIDAGAKEIDALSAFRFRGGGVELAHRGLIGVCRCTFRAHGTALMKNGQRPKMLSER